MPRKSEPLTSQGWAGECPGGSDLQRSCAKQERKFKLELRHLEGADIHAWLSGRAVESGPGWASQPPSQLPPSSFSSVSTSKDSE